jgi:hypothetical protein
MAPTRQNRMLAMVHCAVFDAVNSVQGDYRPYLTKVGTPRLDLRRGGGGGGGARRARRRCCPTRQAPLDAALVTSLAAIPDGRAEDAGAAVGRTVAAAMLANRQDDGDTDVVVYTPGTGPEYWQPTPPGFAPPCCRSTRP